MYLENIKLAFFDYDDTLCIHRTFEHGSRTREAWAQSCVDDDDNWYMNSKYCAPSKSVGKFAKVLSDKGTICNVLTWAETNFLERARWRFINTYYEARFSNLYVSGTREGKLQVAKFISKTLGFQPNEVLLVDDHPATREEFRSHGFRTLSVSELMVMSEE